MTLLPPPQYDVPPPMPVIEQVLPWSEVQRICHAGQMRRSPGALEARADFIFHGCSLTGVVWDGAAQRFVNGKGCLIVRIDDETARRHELGHCNGWPADHPGGR
jgi:hypothetical protein